MINLKKSDWIDLVDEKRLSLGIDYPKSSYPTWRIIYLDWKISLLFQEDIVRPIVSKSFKDIARHDSMDKESRN